jgi:hypothetical protein
MAFEHNQINYVVNICPLSSIICIVLCIVFFPKAIRFTIIIINLYLA